MGIFDNLVQMYKARQVRRIHARFEGNAVIQEPFAVDLTSFIRNESGNRSNIDIGHHCRINGDIVCKRNGRVTIGNYSTIQNGAALHCLQSITIGSFCGIASGVFITDNNTHAVGLESWIRHRIVVAPGGPGYSGLGNGWELSQSAAVVVGDGVWIGSNSSVLKGISIGEGAIVARCSVVTKDVPPYVIVAGNPARVVKELPKPEQPLNEVAQRVLESLALEVTRDTQVGA